jgi:hypothetical protein
MKYLSTTDVILKSTFNSIEFIKDESLTSVRVEFNTNRKLLIIHYSSICTYEMISEYIILKQYYDIELMELINKVNYEDPIKLDPGLYILHKSVTLNGMELALSDQSLDAIFNQFIMNKDPSIHKSDNSIVVYIPSTITFMEYYNLISTSNYFGVIDFYDVIYGNLGGIVFDDRTTINIRSRSTSTISDNKLLIESADYITALILDLMSTYPEIQFYNEDSDLDDTKYKEFIKYKANPESLDNDINTSVVFSDPVYGEIIRTVCNIQFNYHTSGIIKFNKRKFDFFINRFISNKTTSVLPFPGTTRKLKFSVIWNRTDLTGDNPYQKVVQLSDTSRDHYSFPFSARLTITIYRLSSRYPKIKSIVVQSPLSRE